MDRCLDYLFAGIILGLAAGGALSYLYATKRIAAYHKAAAVLGVVFEKIEGEWKALRKG